MTAQTHIYLMTHYHSEIASDLLAASMWLHLGKSCIQSIRHLSWVKNPLSGLEALRVGHLKRTDGEDKDI